MVAFKLVGAGRCARTSNVGTFLAASRDRYGQSSIIPSPKSNFPFRAEYGSMWLIEFSHYTKTLPSNFGAISRVLSFKANYFPLDATCRGRCRMHNKRLLHRP